MRFRNTTALDSARLLHDFERFSRPYRHDGLSVFVRDSRGADFSGRCCYAGSRIYVNLGPRNSYPYLLGTHVAKARSSRTHWWREVYRLVLSEPHQLAVFIYLHEFYHYLVKAAGRNPRRKEAMCDRFATRVLVDEFGCALTTRGGRSVRRSAWDISDVDRFVARAPREGATGAEEERAPAVRIRGPGLAALAAAARPEGRPRQLLLALG